MGAEQQQKIEGYVLLLYVRGHFRWENYSLAVLPE